MITRERFIVLEDLRDIRKASSEKCLRVSEIYNSTVLRVGDLITLDTLSELGSMGFGYKLIERNQGR